MGHQNILTLVDYFETMNNCMFLASVSSDKTLVPGGDTNVTSPNMRVSAKNMCSQENNNEKQY